MAKDDWLLTGEIYAVVSSPASNPRGSGKSLVAIQLALAQANLLNYGLCFNFDINAGALYKFCLYKGYYNVIRQLKDGNVRVRSVVVNDPKKGERTDLSAFIREGETVYVLDEAGVFADSHKWQQIGDKFKADLALLRKFKIRFWWIAQYYEQVVTKLREQTNYIIECCSLLKASRELGGAAKIFRKQFNVFQRLDYERLYSKRQSWSFIRRFLEQMKSAFVRRGEFFSDADILTFEIYQSFGKIGDDPKIFNLPFFPQRTFWKVDYTGDETEFQPVVECESQGYKLYSYDIRELGRNFIDGYDLQTAIEEDEQEREKIRVLAKIYFGKFSPDSFE